MDINMDDPQLDQSVQELSEVETRISNPPVSEDSIISNPDVPADVDPEENVTIKPEPSPMEWRYQEELINLVTDDEQDDDLPGPAHVISSNRSGVPDRVDEVVSSTPVQTAENNGANMHQMYLLRQQALLDKSRPKSANPMGTREATPPAPKKSRGGTRKPRVSRDDAAAARFQKAKEIYEKKKRAKTLEVEEEIEFMKLESEESARMRKKEADLEYDREPSPSAEDEGLFVEEATLPDLSGVNSDDEPASPPKRGRKRAKKEMQPKAGKPPAKKSRKIAGTDYTEEDVEDVLVRARQKAAAKPASKKRGPQKTNAAGRKKGGPSMLNTNSIFGNDVFNDVAATAELAAQPTFDQQSRRELALKQLIASVPEENIAVATKDKNFLDAAIRAFTGTASVKPAQDGNWSVKGMRSSLKHYQILGVAFMRAREDQDRYPRGGILADQMGLGKTIMCLANVANGKPKTGTKLRTTLIVASPALVAQWAREIRTHCTSRRENKQHGMGNVVEYHAGSKIKAADVGEVLQSADIVLTTYHAVAKSYPKAEIPPHLVTAKQKDEWWTEHYENAKGVLHRMRFYRIVLDEAQAIKNYRGSTSIAVRALNGRHHWAITGTPILNTIKEFYPYFKFLREPHAGSYKIFKENFCSPDDPEGVEKLNVFLRKFMIRRTHLDTLFGARLLDLPPPKEHTLWLEFNEIERQIYEIVKKRFIQRINTISKQEGLEKQYQHIWTMITRLRQICGHILLIQGTIVDLLEREDFERLNKITENEEATSEEGAELLVHLRNVLKNNAGVKTIDSGGAAILTENQSLHGGVVEAVGDTEGQVGGKHGLAFRFRKFLDNLHNSGQWDTITQRTLCSGCRQVPHDPYVTSCFHIYCKACLDDLTHAAARRGYDQARCSECGETPTHSSPCEHFEAPRDTSAASDPQGKKPKGKKKDGDLEDWIGMRGEVLPSAKSRATKAAILNWLEEDPTCKTIVYTQFLPMIRILSRMAVTEGWDFCKYTGEMSHEARDKAIEEFTINPEKKLLLASLKCGGLGLNLTMASRVICIDPWWNQAVEQQAFCRVFRIGQQKETRMTRLVVKNTIDEAMTAVKDRKQVEIDEVMNDKHRKEKLSVLDLMRLFGSVGTDDGGRPFIFAQDDGEEHLRLHPDEDDEEAHMGNEE